MDYLTQLLETSQFPWLSAIILGLMTAISPCPLASNITAIGYISKDLSNKHKVFLNGIVYTLGRGIGYTLVALIISWGVDQFSFSGVLQKYGEKALGPFLIFIGLVMIDVIKLRLPEFGNLSSRMQTKQRWNYIDVLLLGIVFALAFCPYSAVLYFGMLIPLTLSTTFGIALPFIFAIATGIPVIIIAWILAYAFSSIGNFYQKLKSIERWFRRIVAITFIAVGSYLTIKFLITLIYN